MNPDAEKALIDYLAANDVPCPACEYNLRGLEDTTCPECGEPITIKSLNLGKLLKSVDIDLIRWSWRVIAVGAIAGGLSAFLGDAMVSPIAGGVMIGCGVGASLIALNVANVQLWMVMTPGRRSACSALSIILLPFGGYGILYGVVTLAVVIKSGL